MKCALPGCSKPAPYDDPWCSRACATIHFVGADTPATPSGMAVGRGQTQNLGGAPVPRTRLQQERFDADLAARAAL